MKHWKRQRERERERKREGKRERLIKKNLIHIEKVKYREVRLFLI